MDEIDLKIFVMLVLNSRLTFREIGKHLGLSPSSIFKRIQNMEKLKIIRSYSTRIHANSLGAICIMVFGKSRCKNLEKAIAGIKANDRTFMIILSNQNQIYIGALLKSIHEMGDYAALVSKIAEIDSPVVGIREYSFFKSQINYFNPKTLGGSIDQLDLSIIRSIQRDSRKSIRDISNEIETTPNTAQRRLSRLIEEGLIELTINPYLEDLHAFFSFIFIEIPVSKNRVEFANEITEKFHPNVMFTWVFSNLPNLILCWICSTTVKKINDIIDEIKNSSDAAVTCDIIRKGMFCDNWIDNLLLLKDEDFFSQYGKK